MTAPRSDVIEVTVLGPGFGECVLVHYGDGHWIVVDSCTDQRNNKPAAVSYLNEIGASCDDVRWIVVSHWHQDHVSGISELIKSCKNASVCLSPVFDSAQFLTEVFGNTTSKQPRIGSGFWEARELLNIRKVDKQRVFRAAGQDKRLQTFSRSIFSHQRDVELWTLSPNDVQLHAFLSKIINVASPNGVDRGRARVPSPNESSVVVWLQIGEIAILLAGDLEEAGTLKSWSSIVASTGRPQTKAQILKIPHHGSQNAHHPAVWSLMLEADPHSVLTPYVLASNFLPMDSDIQRLKSLTQNGYITSTGFSTSPASRLPAVDKTLREMGSPLRSIVQHMGRVTFRNKGVRGFGEWDVLISEQARKL